jgi:hypothetical protein
VPIFAISQHPCGCSPPSFRVAVVARALLPHPLQDVSGPAVLFPPFVGVPPSHRPFISPASPPPRVSSPPAVPRGCSVPCVLSPPSTPCLSAGILSPAASVHSRPSLRLSLPAPLLPFIPSQPLQPRQRCVRGQSSAVCPVSSSGRLCPGAGR